MPFRAASQIKADGLIEAKRLALRAKAFAQAHRNAMAVGPVSGNVVLQILAETKSLIERWEVISAVAGIVAYAQDQENDQFYDVSAEFTAMLAAARAVRDRIIAELPKAPSGHLALVTVEVDGALTTRAFTSAETANLRADLDAFIGTIT